MKQKIIYWTVVILSIIGILNVLYYGGIIGKRLYASIDDRASYDLKKEKHDELAGSAYKYGRMWGELTAFSYTLDGFDKYPFEKHASSEKYRDLSIILLNNRVNDFHCWSADDCADLPDDKNLKDLFGIKIGSDNMPINAFKSGFTDAFVEYAERER